MPHEPEVVILSVDANPTGHERIVAAFAHGDHLDVPLDRERPANCPLIEAAKLHLRRADNDWADEIVLVAHHEPLSAATRERLNARAARPLSDTTEVLHLIAADLGGCMDVGRRGGDGFEGSPGRIP